MLVARRPGGRVAAAAEGRPADGEDSGRADRMPVAGGRQQGIVYRSLAVVVVTGVAAAVAVAAAAAGLVNNTAERQANTLHLAGSDLAEDAGSGPGETSRRSVGNKHQRTAAADAD